MQRKPKDLPKDNNKLSKVRRKRVVMLIKKQSKTPMTQLLISLEKESSTGLKVIQNLDSQKNSLMSETLMRPSKIKKLLSEVDTLTVEEKEIFASSS